MVATYKKKGLASILWDSFVRSIMQSKRTAIANSRRVSPCFLLIGTYNALALPLCKRITKSPKIFWKCLTNS